MNNRFFILVFIAVVFILGGLLYVYNPNPTEYKNPNEVEPVVCTMEAKLCSDGSYVSRNGPNCEFAPCPLPAVETGVPPDTTFEASTTNATSSKTQ